MYHLLVLEYGKWVKEGQIWDADDISDKLLAVSLKPGYTYKVVHELVVDRVVC